MTTALDDLIALLELEPLELNLFRGVSPDEERQRVFGGQVAGQALVAAGRTVERGRVHSLHAYFLRPGDPQVPIIYEVDRIRDGRSFTTRRVVAIQHGRAIFHLSASFHVDEPGPEHQYVMPVVPPPEELPTFRERLEPHMHKFSDDFSNWIERERPIKLAAVEAPRWIDPTPKREAEQHVWIRANGELPDDPLLHACVVAYASDLTLLDTAVMGHQINYEDDDFMIASLDHAMWFHRPFRADEWLLYHQKSPSAYGARGLAEGFIFTRGGDLAITVIQEGLMRPIAKGSAHAGGAQMSAIVDLRSDTVTLPTDEMRAAMAAAEVGDDSYGEDPTVNRLQSLAAALLGTEAALYVPSGTMANQLTLHVLARPGTEVLVPERAHVYRYEAAAASLNAGVQLHPIADPGGMVSLDTIELALQGAEHHLAPVSMLWLENTHMPGNGRPWSAAEVGALAAAAHARGLPLHCDGARIWNAAIALGVAPSTLVGECDTVMFCLSKGLGAPVGSLLCGTAAVIEQARAHRQRLGGGMRQAGIIAAAGIVALETMVERLADDHARARRLAVAIADRFPGAIDPDQVRTNIVCCPIAAFPEATLDRLEASGILAGTLDPSTYRFVTHKDVDDDGLDRACRAIREL